MALQLPNSPLIKKNLPLIVAGFSALLAVILINVYIRQQAEAERRRLLESERNKITVIVAAKDIPRGARISEDMLREIRVNKDKVPPYTATSGTSVLGKVAIAQFQAGEPIALNKVSAPVSRPRWEGLSAKIPPGKRAVTIPVDTITSVAGMARPGDYVDLIGMVPLPASKSKETRMTILPLFQDILILAVEQELQSQPPGKSSGEKSGTNVTLALSPQEANIIAFIQEQGKIRLVLRSPTDKQAARTVPADWDTVLKIILPPQEDFKPKQTVEIFHGLQKEIKVLE